MKDEFISIERLRINKAIKYILELKQNAPDEKALDKLLKILIGEEKYEK